MKSSFLPIIHSCDGLKRMRSEGVERLLWPIVIIIIIIASCWGSGSAIYIPPNLDLKYLTDPANNRITNPIHHHHHHHSHHHHHHHHHRSNISRVQQSWRTFKNDQEISHYLKLFNKKILVWTCKNVVEREWDVPRTPPHLDLYCNVIGHIGSVTWFHGHRPIFSKKDVAKIHNHLDRKRRYTQVISPHVLKSGQHLYKQWTDVRLRIHNVTSKDSGLYSLRVTSRNRKNSDSQQLFVYVAKKDDEVTKKHRKRKSGREAMKVRSRKVNNRMKQQNTNMS